MFRLLRHLSGSFANRWDWNENTGKADASSASRKRRLSEDSGEDDSKESIFKRSRNLGDLDKDHSEGPTRDESPDTPVTSALPVAPRKETEDVRQVTKGVKEVDLEDKDASQDSLPANEARAEENAASAGKPEADMQNDKEEHDAAISEPANTDPAVAVIPVQTEAEDEDAANGLVSEDDALHEPSESVGDEKEAVENTTPPESPGVKGNEDVMVLKLSEVAEPLKA